jgi:hypothetical protein
VTLLAPVGTTTMESMFPSTRRPVRATIAALVLWFGLYVAVAHGLSEMTMDHGKALHGVGICLVVLVATATVAVAAVGRRVSPTIVSAPLAVPVGSPTPSRFAVPSRASPVWLQRFLN